MPNTEWLWVPPSAGDPERFGTVIEKDGGWTLVDPFNDKMKERALSVGAIERRET